MESERLTLWIQTFTVKPEFVVKLRRKRLNELRAEYGLRLFTVGTIEGMRPLSLLLERINILRK